MVTMDVVILDDILDVVITDVAITDERMWLGLMCLKLKRTGMAITEGGGQE